MSKKKGKKRSKTQQNSGTFSPITIGLIKRAWPELLSNSVKGVDPMTPEERERWEKEYAKQWKERHIHEIKHSGDLWLL